MNHNFTTKYQVSASRLKVKVDGRLVVKDLYAVILSAERDSPETRQQILTRVLDQIPLAVANPHQIEVELKGMVRADLCDFKESFELREPLPAARAKVIIRLPCPIGNLEVYDTCVAFEESVNRELNEADIGFVDGHDVGQGEFCIYCYGPKKQALKEAIDTCINRQRQR